MAEAWDRARNSSEAGVGLKWPLITSALATGRGPDWDASPRGAAAGLTGSREALGASPGLTLGSWACFVPLSLLLQQAACKDLGHSFLTDGLRGINRSSLLCLLVAENSDRL